MVANALTTADIRNRMIVAQSLERMREASKDLRGDPLAFMAQELQSAAAGAEKLATGDAPSNVVSIDDARPEPAP